MTRHESADIVPEKFPEVIPEVKNWAMTCFVLISDDLTVVLNIVRLTGLVQSPRPEGKGIGPSVSRAFGRSRGGSGLPEQLNPNATIYRFLVGNGIELGQTIGDRYV